MASEGVVAEQPIPPGEGGWHSTPTAPFPAPLLSRPCSPALVCHLNTRAEGSDPLGRERGVSGHSSMPCWHCSGAQYHPHCHKPGLASGRAAERSPALAAMCPVGTAWTC